MTNHAQQSAFGLASSNGRINGLLRSSLIVLAATGIIALAAKISVPVWPVPVTLQTLAIALIASLAGARLAVAIVLTYLIEGILGLPVFASGGGATYLLGPTGGFLIAYVPMAFVIGKAADLGARRRPVLLLIAMLAADAMVMGLGLAWLLAFAGSTNWIDSAAPLASAWKAAVEPFLLWDALKMAIAAALAWKLGSRASK